MPTYEYECKNCDKIFEVFQSITAEKLKQCPDCGSEIKRLLGTGSGIVFKGTGWYQTDFKNSGKGSSGSQEGSKTSVPKTPAKETSSKETPASSSPAPKTDSKS